VGYDLKGNAYITGIDSTPTIIFQKSKNNGKTWSAPHCGYEPSGRSDRQILVADRFASSQAGSYGLALSSSMSSNVVVERESVQTNRNLPVESTDEPW